MKKFFAIVLTIVTLLSLAACGAKEPAAPTPTEPAKKDFSQYAGIVHDTKTWYDELMALPIANENMTERELRQLCVDAMRMNLSFTWTPNTDIFYEFTLLDRTSQVELPMGIAYSGLCYCNNNAKGNVWKALEYYDPETGVIDVEALGTSFLSVMSSACARGVEWGWSRVSNSHGLETMASYSQYNSKVIPVGTYTYMPGKYSFSSGDGTKQIIQDNGAEVMCESYAMMQLADGLYSSSSYHVIMASSDPVVVKGENGVIDPVQSYILINEQDAVGSKTENKNYNQENGVAMRPLGTVDNKYTFKDLLDKGYVPFTLPELAGKDPVEAGDAWVGTQTTRLENGADVTLKEVMSKTLFTNYAICTTEIQLRDPEGKVLVSYQYHPQTTPMSFNVSINSNDFADQVANLADGKNTVHVMVRMANGELKEAFTTTLKLG